jgi:hypothetical protein
LNDHCSQEYETWNPLKTKDNLNVTVRIKPKSERAISRVSELGEVMKLMHISHSGPFECNEEQILVMSLNESWQGWFRNGTDVDFELT